MSAALAQLWQQALVALAGIRPLTWGAVALVVTSLAYALFMLAISRRAGRIRRGGVEVHADADAPTPEPLVVFLLPCLNEGRVIGASLDRLTALEYPHTRIVVIDDASDDDTAAIVEACTDPRVHLLRRVKPDAQRGKGEALNAAVQHVLASGMTEGRDPHDVVIAVVDADGRLESHTMREVLPYFADPSVGGVQIGVRINNRHVNRLARMQDMEFVVYTDVFQMGRRLLGSVGLGGNGQFMRLAALLDLGPRPWSRSLTEDLDLGVRLLAHGWRNEFCSTAAVHQQGVVDFGRLVRQRTRWFQGHLQSWALLPTVVTRVGGRACLDLVYLLTGPFLLLCASLLTASFVLGLAAMFLHGDVPTLGQMASAYVLGFGPCLLLSNVYWNRERAGGVYRFEIVLLAHLYVLYGLMWYLAGWRAVWRMLTGQTGWAKTARNVESPATTAPAAPTAPTVPASAVTAPAGVPEPGGAEHVSAPADVSAR